MPTKTYSANKRDAPLTLGRNREAEAIARAIQEFLEVLAPVLFSHGITPVTIAGLAKNALVASAARTSRMATGRINQSKVAAVTGLSRAEVRRRLVASPRLLPSASSALDRSARVLAGWFRDPLFLDRNGKPKSLPLRSSATSFAELVRLHSGDIPPRVVLEQLKERGIVRVRANVVSLKSRPRSLSGLAPNALHDVVPYVGEMLAAAAADNSRLAYAQRVTVVAEGESQKILLTERVVRALVATASVLSAVTSRSDEMTPSDDRTTLTIAMTVMCRPVVVAPKKRI
jgi:Family of unknown function (DUF6502)